MVVVHLCAKIASHRRIEAHVVGKTVCSSQYKFAKKDLLKIHEFITWVGRNHTLARRDYTLAVKQIGVGNRKPRTVAFSVNSMSH